jgi:putative ABC transport system ATP-binding protein
MTSIIDCQNLVKIYSLSGVEVMALQGLDLSVEEGEMLGIVGASGSGKTTLMNVLGGLDKPTAGKVSAFGQELLKMSTQELDIYRRTKVGFVWQQAGRNLVPYLMALENVELPMRLAHFATSQRETRARELLGVLGMSERLHHHPDQLSGGEQQRAAIGVAMANQPPLLLADEPTGELDTATSVEVFQALRQVNKAYHTTIIIVSHDTRIGQFVDRVVNIRDGRTSSETVTMESKEPKVVIRESRIDIRKKEDEIHPAPHESRISNLELHPSEELVILDSAGRMQLPREFLERLNIGDRARVELEEGRIAIQPVEGHGRKLTEPVEALPGPEDLYVEREDAAPEARKKLFGGRLKNLPQRLHLNRKGEGEGGAHGS